MTWKLQAISGDLSGQEISIDRDMLVGRHQDADILLQSAEISRRHAAFLLQDSALYVQDLKSSNGTFVNDVQIQDQVQLHDGDIVQFASLKFSLLAPAVNELPVVEKIDVDHEAAAASQPIVQPAEAVAPSEVQAAVQDTTQEQNNETAAVEPAVMETPAAEPTTLEQPEEKVVEPTPAQIMNEQGMPTLDQRDANARLDPQGFPEHVGIPKPAPIPEHVDIHAPAQSEQVSSAPEVQPQADLEEKKNAQVGLFSIIALIILAVIAWLFFK